MKLQLHSTVIFCHDFDRMQSFYQDVLQQEVEVDFGNCIGFKTKISLWKLDESYPIAKKLGRTFASAGNQNMEICFETEDFEDLAMHLKQFEINYLHQEEEETWGQKTMRLYDPENNLIEIGETIPCFVKRFRESGLSLEEVAERTSVPLAMVTDICQPNE